METETKLLLGRILGEIYRLQNSTETVRCPYGPGHVYALLNGFENAVDEELERLGRVSASTVQKVIDVLDPIWSDKEKLDAFKGFYDIEPELIRKGVDRGQAMKVLTYFLANGQFIEIIRKMDTSNSPSECRTFELSEWDQ